MPTRIAVVVLVLAVAATLRGSPFDPLDAEGTVHRLAGAEAIRRADLASARRELEISRAAYVRAHDRDGAAKADLGLARVAELSSDWTTLRARATAARDAFHALRDRAEETRAIRQMTRDPALSSRDDIALLDEAIALARPVADPTLLAEILVDRGDTHFNAGDYAAALSDYRPAISQFEKAGDQDQLARALVSLGRVYRAHGEPAVARPFYERAFAIEQSIGERQGAIQALNAIAVTDDYLHRHDDAMREFERALGLARATGARRIINFQLGNLGGAYLKGGDYEHAIPLLESAVAGSDPWLATIRRGQLAEAYRKAGRLTDALGLDDRTVAEVRPRGAGDALAEALNERALALGRLGRTDAALADVSEALAALERERAHLVPSDRLKQGFGGLYQDVYGTAIELQARRGDPRAALEVSERARSRALLDLLASRDLHVDAAPASAREMQATAARLGSTIVSYFVTADGTFAWVVSADRVRLYRLEPTAARLASLVAATRPRHAEQEPWLAGHRAGTWRELSRLLIDPLRAELPARRGSLLTIVPYGPLLALSFAGLLGADGRYLVEDYTIHYAPSAAVLRFTRADEPAGGGRYLLVADPDRTVPPLPPLPGARAEVQAVAAVVPRGEARVLAGSGADLSVVIGRMTDASVIHLAAHAVVSDADPMESYLALGGGRLRLADIYRLHLRADLVTLSACRTALGPLAGDGVAGLTRAFIYAGAASVVAATWDVADGPTTTLMRDFYRARAGSRSKAAALRDAQLRLLADLRAGRLTIEEPDGPVRLPADPYFWAGFVLVGEP